MSKATSDRGAASTQLVLATPLLMLLLLFAVQAALAWHARHLAQTAASQGLTAARVHGGTGDAGTRAATDTLRQTAGRVLHTTSVAAHRTSTEASVEVHGHVLALVPGLDWTVSGHAAGPVERFTTTRSQP